MEANIPNKEEPIPLKVFVRIKPQNGVLEHTEDTIMSFNSKNQSIAYSFDRVFGPSASTQEIYEIIRCSLEKGFVENCEDNMAAHGGTFSPNSNLRTSESQARPWKENAYNRCVLAVDLSGNERGKNVTESELNCGTGIDNDSSTKKIGDNFKCGEMTGSGPLCLRPDKDTIACVAASAGNKVEHSLSSKPAGKSKMTIIAYGQTGSGKTHTMSGTEGSPGLLRRILKALLEHTPVKVSFVEIYNERIIDLLDNREKSLREAAGQVIIQNVAEKFISTSAEFGALMSKALGNRKTGETKLNKFTSRSHLVVRIETERGYINLLDLAGCENNRRTENEGKRMEESSNINRSLFVFNKVMNAIVNKERRIPYRDSKLTRLLQDSIGGTGECFLITTVVDCLDVNGELSSTLNFAARSKRVLNACVKDITHAKKTDDLFERLACKASKKVDQGPALGRSASCGRPLAFATRVRSIKRGKLAADHCINEASDALLGKFKGENTLDTSSAKDTPGPLTNYSSLGALTDRNALNPPPSTNSPVFSTKEENLDTKRNRHDNSSYSMDKTIVEMTPVTKQKSYKCFLSSARECEASGDYRNALEIYKTTKKFADTAFISEKIAKLHAMLKKEKTKFSVFKVLEILNSGVFIEIKRLNGIGDKRAQSVVDFIAGGNFFESLADLKMIFSDRVIKSIEECIE